MAIITQLQPLKISEMPASVPGTSFPPATGAIPLGPGMR